jgi:hypothetical protein
MLFKNNYEYWIANNKLFDDFRKQFAVIEIGKENFEEK